MWSGDTHLPNPPFDLQADEDNAFWVAMVLLALNIATLVYGVVHLRSRRGRLILLLMMAGVVNSAWEPILDVLVAAFYPHTGIPVAFALMGRSIPVWVVLIYPVFFGVGGIFLLEAFRRGLTRKQVVALLFAPIVVDIALQETLARMGLILYYGNQPWKGANMFPLCWPPCDAFASLLATGTFFLLLPYLRGLAALLLPLCFSLASFVGYAASGLVTMNIVNSQLPNWLSQVGGISAWILAISLMWQLGRFVAIDTPVGARNVEASRAAM